MEKQRSEEWFEKRKGKITGSVIGAILGLNPHSGPSDIMRKMVRDYNGAEPEFKGNIMTEWGNNYEEIAIGTFEHQTGLFVEETGFHVHPEINWLGASPDGLIDDDAIIEIKCPFSKRNSAEFDSITSYPHYFAQIQFELLCTNRSKCYFFQWSPKGTKLEIVKFDRDWIADSFSIIERFYKDFLEQKDNPIYLESLVAEILDEDLENEYESALAEFEKAQERMKQIKSKYIELANGKKTKIGNRIVFPSQRSGTVNYKKIVEKFCPEVDIEEFRGAPTEYMSIR